MIDDSDDLLEQLKEALRCCDMNHQRRMQTLERFDERLKTADELERAEFHSIMQRCRLRRGLLAEEVADAAFELVGTPRPPPLPSDDLPRMFDNRADQASYDHDVDPLRIGAKKH